MAMGELLLHPLTTRRAEAVIQKQPHALLISGASGSGKTTLAFYMAGRILQTDIAAGYPYFLHISPVKQSIAIESIRAVRSFLERRTIGSNKLRRIIVISDAQLMTAEAQNALLKSLEEPPEDTMIILTSSDIKLLRPTIVSRVHNLHVEPLDKSTLHEQLEQGGFNNAEITGAYHMSAGRAGLLTALLEHKDDHPLVQAINHAKEIIGLKPFERLLQVDTLSKDKEQLTMLLEGFERLASSGLQQASLKGNRASAGKFHAIAAQAEQATALLKHNANPKLLLTNLFLKI